MKALSSDDGDGPSLFVGGHFTNAAGAPANYIARWDGHNWFPLGIGLDDAPLCMAPFDDGSGPALFVAGRFTTAGGQSATRLAKWTRDGWQPVGAGPDGIVWAMAPSTLNGGSLFFGGGFDEIDGVPAGGIAQLKACPRCSADLDHDGVLTLFDFLAFINLFNAADPAADCDHSGSLDLFDFLCFTNAFNSGC